MGKSTPSSSSCVSVFGNSFFTNPFTVRCQNKMESAAASCTLLQPARRSSTPCWHNKDKVADSPFPLPPPYRCCWCCSLPSSVSFQQLKHVTSVRATCSWNNLHNNIHITLLAYPKLHSQLRRHLSRLIFLPAPSAVHSLHTLPLASSPLCVLSPLILVQLPFLLQPVLSHLLPHVLLEDP